MSDEPQRITIGGSASNDKPNDRIARLVISDASILESHNVSTGREVAEHARRLLDRCGHTVTGITSERIDGHMSSYYFRGSVADGDVPSPDEIVDAAVSDKLNGP